jgi:hypothetical protein
MPKYKEKASGVTSRRHEALRPNDSDGGGSGGADELEVAVLSGVFDVLSVKLVDWWSPLVAVNPEYLAFDTELLPSRGRMMWLRNSRHLDFDLVRRLITVVDYREGTGIEIKK